MDAIKERIIQHMEAALQTITVANGYANTIANVQRYKASGLLFAEVPFAFLSLGDDLVENQKAAFPMVQRSLEVWVGCVLRQDPADTRSGDEALISFCADVERCLMADPTRGGLAIRTYNPDWMEMAVETDLPCLAKALRFSIDYRHHFQNPAMN